MRAYEVVAGSTSLDGLRRCERPDPVPLPHQILVRIQAAALNYRDLLIPRGHYMGGTVPVNLGKQASLPGVYVGSRAQFERMNAAISVHRMQPVVDREFGFDDAPAAYRHLESGAHFGKVVIRF